MVSLKDISSFIESKGWDDNKLLSSIDFIFFEQENCGKDESDNLIIFDCEFGLAVTFADGYACLKDFGGNTLYKEELKW